jgi:hypothetical protein
MNLHDLLFKPAELRAGETKIIDGGIALCINPHASRGPLWAIKGRCALFTTHGHSSRYMKGLCRNVSPDKGFVTVEIIQGPYTAGTMINITLEEFGRYVNVDDEEDTHLKKVLADATDSGHKSHE